MYWNRRKTRTTAMAVFMGIGLGLSSGCGGDGAGDYKGPERVEVSGSVIVDGKDLAYGQVRFVPTDNAKQRHANGMIQAGKYSIPEAKGPNLGEYKVEITGYAIAPPPPDPDTGEGDDDDDEDEDEDEAEDESGDDEGEAASSDPGQEQILPAKYNVETTLKVTFEAGKHEYNFDKLTLK